MICQIGLWMVQHSIISQHTGITHQEGIISLRATTKGIGGLVPSRIGPVPLNRLGDSKVMVLKAQWRHPVFRLLESCLPSWLEQAALIHTFVLSLLLVGKWFVRRYRRSVMKLWKRKAGMWQITLVKMPSCVWLTIPQGTGVTLILITYKLAINSFQIRILEFSWCSFWAVLYDEKRQRTCKTRGGFFCGNHLQNLQLSLFFFCDQSDCLYF